MNWSILGPAFTTITSPFTVGTTAGSSVNVFHNPGELFERRNQTTGGWAGNFLRSEALLWNRGDNGSMTFDPANLVSGAGFNVQADQAGVFTFRLDAYDAGGGLIGSVTELGLSNTILGTAIFIGFTSGTSNVDKFVATLTDVTAGGSSNFAIDSLVLAGSVPPPAPEGAAVPEPSVYGLFGAFLVFAAVVHRKLRRHSQAF